MLFDQATHAPKKLLAFGDWRARRVLACDNLRDAPAGDLTLRADLENLVEGAALELICSFGPAGLATGEEEGWVLEGTPRTGRSCR